MSIAAEFVRLLPERNKGNSEVLSPWGRRAYDAATADDVLRRSPVDKSLMLTSGNQLELIMNDGPRIYSAFQGELARARHAVYMAFYAWDENSSCTAMIGEGLRQAAAHATGRLSVKMLLSDFELGILHGMTVRRLYNSIQKWRIDPNRIDFQIANYPFHFFGSLHDKLVIIDCQTLLLTGANPQKQHDAPPPYWHDTGYVLRGPVAWSATNSFDEAWHRHGQRVEFVRPPGVGMAPGALIPRPRVIPMEPLPPSRNWLPDVSFPEAGIQMLALPRLAHGDPNSDVLNPQDQAWITLLRTALISIDITSPNIDAQHFRDELLQAAARGVRIRLLTTKGFNDFHIDIRGETNEEVIQSFQHRLASLPPVARDCLQMRWFSTDGVRAVDGNEKEKGPSHAKYFSVDGQVAIIGSGNMDEQSWYNNREFNVLIDDGATVSRLNAEIFNRYWDRAIPV